MVVGLALLFVLAGFLSDAGGGGFPGSGLGRAAFSPAAGTPPTIFSFTASPSTFFQGASTTLSVSASSAFSDPLAYSYTGLPAGCASLNSSSLPCTPTVGGAFNVTVEVTDTGTHGVAQSYANLYVNPVLNESFFTTQSQIVSPEWVNFTESGLPFATPWTVQLGSDVQTGVGVLSFLEMGGSYSYSVPNAAGYSAVTSSGTVAVNGFPASVFVSFTSYVLTFTDSGLTAGTVWSVSVAGDSLSAVAPASVVFSEPFGTFPYAVGWVTGYSATPRFGSVAVAGAMSVPISFSSAPANLAYNVTFSETGLPSGQFWSVDVNGSEYGGTVVNVTTTELNGTYNYSIEAPNGFVASPSSGQVTVSGIAPSPVLVTFSAAPTYTVAFQESGLPSGTSWSVAVNDTTVTGTSGSLSFSLANGSYGFSVGGSALESVRGYAVAPQNGPFSVSGAARTINVAYSAVSYLGPSDTTCSSINSPPFYQNFCYPEAQTPTLLTLTGGSIGLASALYTNATDNTCPGARGATNARVGFSLSTSGGAFFGAARTLGNDTCQYLDSIEPSFATNGTAVFGAFVEENSSAFASNYIARGTDGLGFVRSTDGGQTFSPAVTLDGTGNIALPSVAAFGSTVYVVYEDIANSTTAIPGGFLPIALKMVYSSDGGVSWSSPVTLPGLNASQQYNAMSPSVTVNRTGTLAVAYATDRSCLLPGSSGGCAAFGDSIVLATSTSNGSSWQGPTPLAGKAGETLCYTGSCYGGFFQSTPQVTAAFSPGGQSLYVAYAATYNQGAGLGSSNYNHTGVFAAEDSNGTISAGPVVAPSGPTALRSFNPGLGVSSQGAYLTYVQANESAGTSSFANSLSQWVAHSPLGASLSWLPPVSIFLNSFVGGGSVNGTRTSYPGFSSSVAFDASGNPVVAFSVPEPSSTTIARSPSYYYVNNSFPTMLVTGTYAVPGAANTVQVTFSESGLPVGRDWQFTINGVTYALATPAIEITNIPIGVPLLVGANYQPEYWEVVSNEFPASLETFYFSGSSTFSFQVWEGLEFHTIPSGIFPWLANICCYNTDLVEAEMLSSPFGAYAFAEWEQYSTYNFPPPYTVYSYIYYDGFAYSGGFSQYWSSSCVNVVCNYQTPWYFPLGSTVELIIPRSAFAQLAPVYFSGTGVGSYTGGLSSSYCYGYYACYLYSGHITMDGAINETLWFGNAPINLATNVTFSATGIPASSTYSAVLDTTAVTGNASAPAVVYNVGAGAHAVSGISATSTVPGWEYFGSVAGPNPFVTPLVSSVSLDFTALVNVSAPSGTVTFHASNLTQGTAWAVQFNGTTFRSTSPWINISTRPGTFLFTPEDAVSPSGTAGYVPVSGAGNISVLPGRTYNVSYVPAYQVELLATPGGFVSANLGSDQSVATLWEAAGSIVQLHSLTTTGYTFGGWNGTGTGAYTGTLPSPSITVGGPIVETASFLPLPGARFNLTFVPVGVPAGAWWTVELNGAGFSSDTGSLTVGHLWPWNVDPAGRYTLSVPVIYLNSTSLTRFVPTGAPPVVGTNGTSTPPVAIVYNTQYYVQVTTAGGGTVVATTFTQPVQLPAWEYQSEVLILSALPNPGYTFAGWQGSGNGSYSGPIINPPVSVFGPISEVALFTPIVLPPPTTYSIEIDLATTLAPGTTWSVTFGGVGYATSGPSLTIPGLAPGNYGMVVNTVTSPDGLVQYRATSTDPVAYTVSKNASFLVDLYPYYWVQVTSSSGGTVSPVSGYYPANSILYLVASPQAGYSFSEWSGGSTGGYTGTNATASIIVTAPLTEVADFHSTGGSVLAPSIWSSPETWAGVAAVGLIVGLGVGLLVSRILVREHGAGGRSSTPPPRPRVGGTR